MVTFLELMRPGQWIKNLAVLAGAAFALRVDRESLIHTAIIFAAFCLVSSATYCVNDILDRKADRLHPVKKHRPLARGAVGPASAMAWAGMLLAAGVALSASFLPIACTVLIAGYFCQNMAYSLALKRRIILDVILIAIGFVLRATAGAAAVEAYVSPWLIVCTFTLCLFLGFGKRRCEIAAFGSLEAAAEHRQTLLRYTPELLNHLISVSAGIAIMTFLLYTMDRDPAHAPPFPKHHLLYTIPLVVYGVFRYAMLILAGKRHGPMDIFLHDGPFVGTILIWAVLAAAIVTETYWLDVVPLADLIGGGVSKVSGS